MAAARTANLNEGLRRLGLNADTDDSVFFFMVSGLRFVQL